MIKQNIVIATGRGGHLGTGHVQRMLTLASYIQHQNEFNPLILIDQREDLPAEFQNMQISALPDCSIIIRDKRDSSKTEIEGLRKYAPVIAVDDTGEGRSIADYVLDLLPNLMHRLSREFYREDFFLYGYNFTRGIKTAFEKIKEKTIDIAIYTGAIPQDNVTESLKKILPEKALVYHLTGEGPIYFFTRKPVQGNLTYAEILLSSKILITHFGIALFEGYTCGCRLFTINPSKYHKDLTSLVQEMMGVTDLNNLSETNNNNLKMKLREIIKHNDSLIVPEKKLLNPHLEGAEKFYALIQSIISPSF